MFEGSIGNTFDNSETVSEAASNHSVALSLELETEDQDVNLSNMVSTNVCKESQTQIDGKFCKFEIKKLIAGDL